jgi:hypothetical protein
VLDEREPGTGWLAAVAFIRWVDSLVCLRPRGAVHAWFYRREQAKRAAKVGVLVDDLVREDPAMKALGVMETRNGVGL